MIRKHLFVIFCLICLISEVYANPVVNLNKSKPIRQQMDKAYGAKDNTVFYITLDFDLGGQTVNLPESSVLKFEGGTLRNGSIMGANTRIDAPLIAIFSNVSLKGIWVLDGVRAEWFGARPNRPNVDCSDALNKAIVTGGEIKVPVILSSANYYIQKTIELNAVGLQGVNSQHSIITFSSNVDVAVSIQGQFRTFKNIRVQSKEPTKKKGICVKVGDLKTKNSSTRGYIEDIVVTGGDVGLDLQYQWCQKITGIIAKNNNIGIRSSKTTTFIENAIVEDNNICGVLSFENGVKLYSSVIEGNSIGCYFNGKENALLFCSFEGNDMKHGISATQIKKYGITETKGGHIFVGLDRPVAYMVIEGCHISESGERGTKRMVVDRCQCLVMFGNTNMSSLTMTRRCNLKLKD